MKYLFFFQNLKEDSILVDNNFYSIKEFIFKQSLLKYIVYPLKKTKWNWNSYGKMYVVNSAIWDF